MGGFGTFFGIKKKSRTNISTAPSSSNKPGVSVGQNCCKHSLAPYSHPPLQSLNQRSERYPHSQPHPKPRSQPRLSISTAPTSSNKPWVSVGQNGGISTVAEYAHPSLQPLDQPSDQYPHTQPNPQPHSQSHSQSHSQPRPYLHPPQFPVHTAARKPNPTKPEHYFPPQHPNPSQSYSVAGPLAHQPAILGAGYNNRGIHRIHGSQQRSTQLSMEVLPSHGHVNPYGNYQQAPAHPVSPEAPAQGQYQGWKSNQTASLGLNKDGVSPMEKQYPEFPSRNQYSR